MAREEQGAGPSKQEEALKRYMEDSLRRFEEREQAIQRETQDARRESQDAHTTTEMAICGAPFWDSVAHPPNCWMRHRILATKIYSVAHPGRAPQKNQLSVAHPHLMRHRKDFVAHPT